MKRSGRTQSRKPNVANRPKPAPVFKLTEDPCDEGDEVFVESIERTFVLKPVSDLQIVDNITIVSARGGDRKILRAWRG